jgi:hypothetical protein
MFLFARFQARDYQHWKQAFDNDVDTRVRHGAHNHQIFRHTDNPDDYLIVVELASRGGAEGLSEDPTLIAAIGDSGIEGGAHHVQYTIDLYERLEQASYD